MHITIPQTELWSRQGELESLLISKCAHLYTQKVFRSAKRQGLHPFVELPCEIRDLQHDLPQTSMKHSLQIYGNWTLSPATAPKMLPLLTDVCVSKPKSRHTGPMATAKRAATVTTLLSSSLQVGSSPTQGGHPWC